MPAVDGLDGTCAVNATLCTINRAQKRSCDTIAEEGRRTREAPPKPRDVAAEQGLGDGTAGAGQVHAGDRGRGRRHADTMATVEGRDGARAVELGRGEHGGEVSIWRDLEPMEVDETAATRYG